MRGNQCHAFFVFVCVCVCACVFVLEVVLFDASWTNIFASQAQHKVATLEDNSTMLEQQVESLKGMVSSSESQQQEHAKAQMNKISALQEQVEGLKTSSRKAESECASLKSQLADATRKEEEVDACTHGRASLCACFYVCLFLCLYV